MAPHGSHSPCGSALEAVPAGGGGVLNSSTRIRIISIIRKFEKQTDANKVDLGARLLE